MKSTQFCPKCKSNNIKLASSTLGDPAKIQGLIGWECLDCGYAGKDFFLVSEQNYKKIKK